jgi:tRNA(Ile2)-agmatinylcytidine synthase
MIFRSNQGTGVHLIPRLSLSSPKAYGAGHVTGQISLKPSVQQGGHVFFKIRDDAAEAWCAIYEPAGPLRKVTLQLRPDDIIQVGAGVRRRTSRHPPVLNVEYLSILNVAAQLRYVSPPCPRCPGRMTSMGTDQGRRCDKCGFRDPKAGKTAVTVPRSLAPGLYLPPPRAQRHLSKPLQRYGMEKERWNGTLIEAWSSFHASVPIRAGVPRGS